MASAQGRARLIREIARNTTRRNNSTTSSFTSHGSISDTDPRFFDPDNEANDMSTRKIDADEKAQSKTSAPILEKKPDLPAKVTYRLDRDAFKRTMAQTLSESSDDDYTHTSDFSIEIGRGGAKANRNQDEFPMGGTIHAEDFPSTSPRNSPPAQASSSRAFGHHGNSRDPHRGMQPLFHNATSHKENADPMAETATNTMTKPRSTRFAAGTFGVNKPTGSTSMQTRARAQQPHVSTYMDVGQSFVLPPAANLSEVMPGGVSSNDPAVRRTATAQGADADALSLPLDERNLLIALRMAQDEAAGLNAMINEIKRRSRDVHLDEITTMQRLKADFDHLNKDIHAENAELRAANVKLHEENAALKEQLKLASKASRVHETDTTNHSLFSVGPSRQTTNMRSDAGADAQLQSATWLTQGVPQVAQGVRNNLEDKRASKKSTAAKETARASEPQERIPPADENMTSAFIMPDLTFTQPLPATQEHQQKKSTVTVRRPIPVSDRIPAATEDDADVTMRPAHSPGVALAVTIQRLEGELEHHKAKLAESQERYNQTEPGLSRRERARCHRRITRLLGCCELTADMIYALYDVLEGQKATGTEMTEEEVEVTLTNLKNIMTSEREGMDGTETISKPSNAVDNRTAGSRTGRSFMWNGGGAAGTRRSMQVK